MEKIVIVTRPTKNKKKIQFAFDLLERQGMNPYWGKCKIRSHSHTIKYVDGWEVARPALIDDPAEIVEKEK